jgi:ethanolamine kinase
MPQVFRDNPDWILPLVLDVTADNRDDAMLDLVRQLVPSWSTATQATVTVVLGGITNQLFRLACEPLEPLLIRVYGANTEVVIDRESENRLFADLSRRGFAPVYHGRFENGRVEGWCAGFRALTPPELGTAPMRRLIAQRLWELHSFPPPTPTPRMWRTLGGWMNAALTVHFDGRDYVRRQALNLGRYAEFLKRLKQYEQGPLTDEATAAGGAVALRPVAAHNDLLAGNVLTNRAQDRVRFIDYEYGATAPAAFDVANHFCEYAGFDSDFAAGFPSRTDRHDFIHWYLGSQYTPTDVAAFSRIVEFYVLPDHLWWGTWAVVQARYSPIDFDYLDYARLRLAGFELHLREFGFEDLLD